MNFLSSKLSYIFFFFKKLLLKAVVTFKGNDVNILDYLDAKSLQVTLVTRMVYFNEA